MEVVTKRKKILFLHSGAELYGADQILLTIASNLDKRKYEPIVILPNDGPLVEELSKKNVRVNIISYPIIRRKYFNTLGIIRLSKEYFFSCRELKKFVEKEKIDIIHSNTLAVLEGIYLKKRTSIKLITHIHEMIDNPKIIAKFLYKINLKYCDKMIVVSNSVKTHISKLTKNNLDKIIVIHNGIEQIKYNSDNEKYYSEFNIPSNSKVVAIVGRINDIKGQNHFIDAMKNVINKNNKVFGLIIGDAFSGQEWRVEQLKKLIKDENLEQKVIYCGFRRDIKNIYNIINLLVLSSIKNDSFPTVVLEAMSCGIPTIAYKCGGVKEMIENSVNGYLIEQGNIMDLSKKIEEVIGDEETLNLLSKNSILNYRKNFSIKKFINNIENIYELYGGLDE